MNLINPEWAAPENIRAFSTVRYGGYSVFPFHGDESRKNGFNLGMHVSDDPVAVRKNRALLKEALPAEPVWLNQVHGTTVIDASAVSSVPDADAAFATKPGVVCLVMTADCLPVLFCDRKGSIVAAAHAGWRGLAGGVLDKTVEALRAFTNSGLIAWLGPAIGAHAFEVGEDVRDVFVRKNVSMSSAFVPVKNNSGKYMADIYALATMTLKELDVVDVFGGDFCTVTDKERFFSYRRDGITGRMATGIWFSR